MIGYYSSFESFGSVDGPGLRSILFLTGCPFRCLYCHNPETWQLKNGKEITSEEAFQKLIKYRPYWGSDGGITISGGEPLSQLDFLIELGTLAKQNNISYVIDTAGGTFRIDEAYLQKFDKLLDVCTLFLLDIKTADEKLHKKITGVDFENVDKLYHYLAKKNFPIWVRHVLVPGLTSDHKQLIKTKNYLSQFTNIKRIEVLPYHNLALEKYQKLGIKYPLINTPLPSKEEIAYAKSILEKNL